MIDVTPQISSSAEVFAALDDLVTACPVEIELVHELLADRLHLAVHVVHRESLGR